MFGTSAFSQTPFAALPAASSADVTVALTGVVASGAVGTVSVNSDVTIALTGVVASGAVGTVSAAGGNITVALSGVFATGNVGIVVNNDVTVALTGVSAFGNVGTVTPKVNWLIIDNSQTASWSIIDDS